MSYRIRADEPVDEGIRRIVREQVDRAAEEAASSESNAAEAVHKVRKRCKQIRSVLKLIRPVLGDAYVVENAWYRDAAARLSGIRDAQVVNDAYDDLLIHFKKHAYGAENNRVTTNLRSRKKAAAQSAEVDARLRTFCEAMEKGRARIGSWGLHDDGFNDIRTGLKKSYSRGRRAMRRAFTEPSSETMHEWRKRVKDHENHVRLLQDVWKEPMKARRREVETLADCLGDDHDLEVLREALVSCREGVKAKPLRAVLALIDERQGQLRAAALTIGDRLYAEKRKAFATRIERYWTSWRECADVSDLPERMSA